MGKKLKTNKGTAKRFRRTASGKFRKMRSGKRHLLQGKSAKRRRHLRKGDLVSGSMETHLRRLMPYA